MYRGRLHDGRDVAVKVQYPGVNDAVRADMQNLGMLLRLAKRITPQMDVKAVGEEIRARIIDELDYELEASNHRTLARLYRGHPFIHVPAVVTDLCRERVIVTEYVEGERFEQIASSTQEERDRVGEIVYRFYFGSMYRHRKLLRRPAPGEHDPDGRRARSRSSTSACSRSSARTRWSWSWPRAVPRPSATRWSSTASGPRAASCPSPRRSRPEDLMAYVEDAIWWYITDEEARITPEAVQRIAIQAGDPRSTHFRTMRHQDVNPEHLMGRRLELLVLAVLGELHATANWHRIAREWMYGSEPATELGRAGGGVPGRAIAPEGRRAATPPCALRPSGRAGRTPRAWPSSCARAPSARS